MSRLLIMYSVERRFAQSGYKFAVMILCLITKQWYVVWKGKLSEP